MAARSWSVIVPRQPSVGKSNLRTKRSENGVMANRASFTGLVERVTSIRAPAGTSTVRRPSQHSTPDSLVRCKTSTEITDSGDTTIGVEYIALADTGIISIDWTSLH